MSEHLWFVPVTGGSARGPAPTPDLTNVQWNFSIYPVNQDPQPGFDPPHYRSVTKFTMGEEGKPPTPSLLNECHGRWRWVSSSDGQIIETGGQLAVGTVFARKLHAVNSDDPPPIMWDQVDVWAKYRVNNVDRLDHIFLTINDSAGRSACSADLIGVTKGDDWRVVTVSHPGPWDDQWVSDNLRVTLTFQGTTVPNNVGIVVVDVEWFAIMLKLQS